MVWSSEQFQVRKSLPGNIVVTVVVVLLVVDEVVPAACVFVSSESSQLLDAAAGCCSVETRTSDALLQQLLLVKFEFARHCGVSVELKQVLHTPGVEIRLVCVDVLRCRCGRVCRFVNRWQ